MLTSRSSGNEIYCLAQKGYKPGNIVIGNSIYSLGFIGSVIAGFKTILGEELHQVTQLIESGRQTAYQRMLNEATAFKGSGIISITNQLVNHPSYIEFLSIGSLVNHQEENTTPFSTTANGQELYAQLDANYKPICFAFGNVAYSLGLGQGLLGSLKTFRQGEIKEFSNVFNHTRHLALERIISNAKQQKANAVLGIETSLLPFGKACEMLMVGTAAYNSQLADNEIISSDLTPIEMWNLANMGYAPMRLLLGTSIYSLGLIGSVTSTIKSFFRGEINELSKMLYAARENALNIINDEAKTIGADQVVGVKTYVYPLGNGLIEFLAIGTAVKKLSKVKTESPQLPPQVVMLDKNTFYNGISAYFNRKTNTPLTTLWRLVLAALIIFVIVWVKIKT